MYTSSLNSSSSSRSHSSPNFLLTDWKKSYKCATYSICRCLYWTKSLRLKDDHKSKASQDFLFPSIPVLFAANSCQKRSWDYKNHLSNFMPPEGSPQGRLSSAIIPHQEGSRERLLSRWLEEVTIKHPLQPKLCVGFWMLMKW